MARSCFGITSATSPRRPLLTPLITTTVSPLRMRAAISQHLGREGDDLHELAGPQFTHHRSENTRADRLHLLVDQHRRVAIETNGRTIGTAHRIRRAHDHRLMHVALLHLAARNRLTDRYDDDIADRGGLALRATEHLDAQYLARTGIVGD